MNSVSTTGQSTITLQFALDRSIDAAAQDGNRRRRRGQDLPSTAGAADAAQSQSGDFPIREPGAGVAGCSHLGRRRLRREPARAAHPDDQRRGAGAGLRVEVAVRIQLDPNQLASAGSPHRCRQALAMPAQPARRHAVRSRQATSVQATGQLMDAQAYADDRRVPEQGAGAAPAAWPRVRQRAERQGRHWYNDTRGIVLAVQQQPGTNTIEIVDAVRASLVPGAAPIDQVVDPLRPHQSSTVGARPIHAAARTGTRRRRHLRFLRSVTAPSSRTLRCRCRSSARSRSCMPSDSRSTTCR